VILIVDDEPSLRFLMRMLLERSGHAVQEAPNGAVALRACEASPPDVLVTDLMMPVMTGVELIRRLRAAEATRDLPIVVVSGSWTELDLDGMADAVLDKPFDEDELLATVDALMEAA
jgi:CheY-like chemotaxis protein